MQLIGTASKKQRQQRILLDFAQRFQRGVFLLSLARRCVRQQETEQAHRDAENAAEPECVGHARRLRGSDCSLLAPAGV